MTRDRVVAGLVAAAVLFFANAALAVECPQILNFGQLAFEQHFDVDALPAKPFLDQTFYPIAVMHAVAIATPLEAAIEDVAWCHDLDADSVSHTTSLTVPGEDQGTATATVSPDGSLAVFANGSVAEVLPLVSRAGSSLVQVGFRDVIHVGGTGTDPVELTLHRSINGSWTSLGPHGNTLDVEGTRTFTLTIHEFAIPNDLTSVTRRVAIDDNETVGFLNGENDYVFDAVPGHTLVLTLYLEAGLQCNAGLSFEQVQYLGCNGYVDFGDQFGAPIALSFSSPPENPLTAESGFTYVPEPDALPEEGAAGAALATMGAFALRQRRTASRKSGNTFDTLASR